MALCAAFVSALAPVAVSQGAKRRPTPTLTPATVSIQETRPGTAVPPEFLGLSFEL